MNEQLKKLFESAGIPADVGDQALAIFEAAVKEGVDVGLAEHISQMQEAFESKFAEQTEAFISEKTATIETLMQESLLEWAKENAVAIDGSLKIQIAESFLRNIGTAMTNEGYTLVNEGGTTLTEQAIQESSNKDAQIALLQAKLAEVTNIMDGVRRKEIVESATQGLSDVQTERVKSLCESLSFKDIESFASQVSIIAEAFGGKKVVKEGTSEEDKGDEDPAKKAEGDKGVDDAEKKEGETSDKKGDEKIDESTNAARAAAHFLATGRHLTA